MQHGWRLYLCLFSAVFVIGCGLRFWQYGVFPPVGESADELAWTMVGASLLQTGVPSSWSYFEYPQKVLQQIHGNELPIVRPYLDHPPLFGFIPGSMQVLSGRDWADVLPVGTLRFPVVLLSCLNLVIFALVLRVLFKDKLLQLIGFTLYATSPMVVFSGRVIVAEQLLTTFLLLLVWWVVRAKKHRYDGVVLGLLSMAIVFTKASGIVLGFSLLVIAWLLGQRRRSIYMFAGLVLGFCGILLYAMQYDFALFLHIQAQQQSWRYPGLLSSFMGLLFRPELVNSVFFDGLFLTGVLSIFSQFWRTKEPIVWQGMSLIVAFFCAFIFYAAGETTLNELHGTRGGSLYGWYWYPLLPIFVLGITRAVEAGLQKLLSTAMCLPLIVLAIPVVRLAYYGFSGTVPTEYLFPKLLIALVMAGVFSSLLLARKWPRAVVVGLVCVVAICNLLVIATMDSSLYWSDGSYWNQL